MQRLCGHWRLTAAACVFGGYSASPYTCVVTCWDSQPSAGTSVFVSACQRCLPTTSARVQGVLWSLSIRDVALLASKQSALCRRARISLTVNILLVFTMKLVSLHIIPASNQPGITSSFEKFLWLVLSWWS